MRWSLAWCLGAALAVSLAGCRSCDKVEAELRARESDVRELRDQLDRSEFQNKALVGELAARHGMPGPDGVLRPPSEPYPVRSIVLGRGTSGRMSETVPGDDALQVQLEPRDTENESIKAPGCATIELMEVNAEGLKRLITVWEVTAEQLRRSWRNGLLNTGYFLTLPWKVWPNTEKLRVVARFKLIDGRTFEADKDITVRLLPAALRKVQPPPDAGREVSTDVRPAPASRPAPTTSEPPMVEKPKGATPKPAPVLPAPTPVKPPVKKAPAPETILPPPIPQPPGPSGPPLASVRVMPPVPLSRSSP